MNEVVADCRAEINEGLVWKAIQQKAERPEQVKVLA